MKTVFVSSTFRDMHYERDAIREITAPLLNAEARKHGDELDFCDLRWGINTGDLDTEEGSKKVLEVCLDEIDRCDPPMVVILGDRYGWVPEMSLIKTAAERKQLELDDLERSVTALEIEYGALCDNKKVQNTLFYFRKIEGDAPADYLAEDEKHKEKVLALKNRIENLTGGKIKDYTLKWNGISFDGVNAFAEMLAEDIKAMLMPEWRTTESLAPFERERRVHSTFIREKNVMFKARMAEALGLMDDALSQPVTIIKGEVGSGKTTLFSHMATELEKTNWTVLPFIAGLTTESSSADDIIKNTVYFIEEKLNVDHYIDEKDPQTGENIKHTLDEWREKLAEMCFEYTKNGSKLLIMLDAADQLIPSEERDNLYFIPMSVSENIHFVMTCTTDFKTPGRENYALRQLSDKDKREVIDGILARSGRELSTPVINEMLKLKASDYPLYLSLLIQRLLMMNRDDFVDIKSRGDGMAAIEQHQLELIKNKCPDDLDEMSVALLNEAGKRINEKLVINAAKYLAVSRHGLRRKDLSALLGEEWTEIDFSHFINYMNDCFLQKDDGRYDFAHKSIRAGFRRQCRDFDEVNREILKYLKSLQTDDTVRMSEIIYHTIKADDKGFFVDYIVEYEQEYKKHDDKIYMYHAARDTFAQCIIDGGKWIIDVLNEAKKYEPDEKLNNLVYFCIFDLNKAFSGSQKELEIKLSILLVNCDFSEHLYNKLKTNECNWNLSLSYASVARTYEKLGGKENLEQALELYYKGLEISKQLFKEVGTAESKRALSYSCNNVAGTYEELGGRANLEQALELYYEGLEINELLSQEADTTENKRDISHSYGNVARIYEKLGERENLEHAKELYYKCLEISEQLFKETGTLESKRDLSLSYERVSGIHLSIYWKISGNKVVDTSSLGLLKFILPKIAPFRKEYTLSKNFQTNIFAEFGGRENLERAQEFSHKCLEIREQLFKEIGTLESKRDLYICYVRVAGIYKMLGGKENLEQALELYHKGLEISVQLSKEIGTLESKRDLSYSYKEVARIYEKLGGKENLKRALEFYNKELEIREQLVNILKTVDAYDDLATSLVTISRHPSIAISTRKKLFNRGLDIYKELYEQTKLDRYNDIINVYSKDKNFKLLVNIITFLVICIMTILSLFIISYNLFNIFTYK